MNLIEQLGEYRMAKEVMDSIPKDGRSYTITRDDTGISFNTSELHGALLEHRRTHNIFEIGDKIIITDDFYDKNAMKLIFNIFAINEDDRVAHISTDIVGDDGINMHYGISGQWFEHMRHATDEEIKAGHRL